jgi:hypothetical protein
MSRWLSLINVRWPEAWALVSMSELGYLWGLRYLVLHEPRIL